jgi:hypothetical protein
MAVVFATTKTILKIDKIPFPIILHLGNQILIVTLFGETPPLFLAIRSLSGTFPSDPGRGSGRNPGAIRAKLVELEKAFKQGSRRPAFKLPD